jgi:integrase/recombinase XerD
MRRSLGYKLQSAGTGLLDFVTFMEHHRASYITHSLALARAKQPSGVQPAEWARRLSHVRVFARHRSATDPRTQIPPAGLLPYRPKRAQPYIYSDEEIRDLLRGAQAPRQRWTTALDLPLPVRAAECLGAYVSAKRGTSNCRTLTFKLAC